METNENKHLNTNHTTVEPYKNINYGWKCPVCGRILAPWVPECPCNGFSNPRDITCQVKNLKASESILEGPINHIPQFDSISADIYGDGLRIEENKVDIPRFMLDHNDQMVNDIMHKCMNPFEGCKQTEGGGYIIDEPLIEARPIDKKNNVVSLNKFKKDKGDKK